MRLTIVRLRWRQFTNLYTRREWGEWALIVMLTIFMTVTVIGNVRHWNQ